MNFKIYKYFIIYYKIFILYYYYIILFLMHTFVIVLIIILVLIYIGNKAFFNETFESTNESTNKSTNKSTKLYVFVSSHCPHCHTYLDNHHKDVSDLVKSKGLDIQKVQSDGTKETSDLFDKYGVQYVPTAVIVKDNKVYKNLGSNITPQSVKYALEN